MSNLKLFDPNDIDESLLKLVEHEGKHHVLLPFVDATGAAPEYRSLGQPTEHGAIRMPDLAALTAAMRARAAGTAIWFILFNTPWLLAEADGQAILQAKAARR